jgi:hypothetical protein
MTLQSALHLIHRDGLFSAPLGHDSEVVQVFEESSVAGDREDYALLLSTLIHQVLCSIVAHSRSSDRRI